MLFSRFGTYALGIQLSDRGYSLTSAIIIIIIILPKTDCNIQVCAKLKVILTA